MQQDYYKDLEIDKYATSQQIADAYVISDPDIADWHLNGIPNSAKRILILVSRTSAEYLKPTRC